MFLPPRTPPSRGDGRIIKMNGIRVLSSLACGSKVAGGNRFLRFGMDPQLCFSKRIVIMEDNSLVKLLLNRFRLPPLCKLEVTEKPNANERTTWGAIHLGTEKHQERFGIVSGDEPRRSTQFRSDIVFPDTSHQCEAEAVQKNIRTGSPSALSLLLLFLASSRHLWRRTGCIFETGY